MAGGRTPPNPSEAARFSITIDGVEIASFLELVELTSGLDPSGLTLAPGRGGKRSVRKLPGKRVPPTVTLKRGLTSSLDLWAWHKQALEGAAARRNAVLVMFDVQGEPVARFHLESAWPSKVEISGLKAGASEVLMETVLIVAADIERLSP